MVQATQVAAMPASNISLPLFVPADRPERLVKAATSGADAIIVDLEDAVGPDSKAATRDRLGEELAVLPAGTPVVLRINGEGTPWHAQDVVAAAQLPVSAIMLPMAESGTHIERVRGETGLPVVALLETALGMHAIDDIAAAASRLAFGSIDYAADLAMDHTQRSLAHARATIVLASRIADLPAPLDGVTVQINDPARLEDDCAYARELGFGGKLLIHPVQIAGARAAFMPSEQQIDWARRVIAISSTGCVATVDGAMVDAPVIARARQLLARVNA